MAATVHTTATAAAKLGTTPRVLRKFLRTQEAGVGKGSRYSLTGREVQAMRKQFDTWVADQAKPTADEAPKVDLRKATDAPA